MNNNFLNIYLSKKIFVIFLMGIASGIPLYMVLSTLFIWLTREKYRYRNGRIICINTNTMEFKISGAPIIDTYKIPVLTEYLGMRKSWLLITQIFW